MPGTVLPAQFISVLYAPHADVETWMVLVRLIVLEICVFVRIFFLEKLGILLALRLIFRRTFICDLKFSSSLKVCGGFRMFLILSNALISF